MTPNHTVIDSILSLHQHIILLHRKYADQELLNKLDDFMLSLQTVGLLDGIHIHGKEGRYFLIEATSWKEVTQRLRINAVPNFVLWEESEFFTFLDSLLKPLESHDNKILIHAQRGHAHA